MIIVGIAVSIGATVVLAVFAVMQWRKEQEVKNIPQKYEEWRRNYRIKKFYIMIAQLAGVVVALIGASM